MPDSRTAVVVCHARFLDLASFGEVLDQSGYVTRYYDAGQDDLSVEDGSDILITLGGPIGAYERADYPWIDDEAALLRRHLDADRPLLAICLGAQILAQTLGARVYNAVKEIGWAPIDLTNEGCGSILGKTGEQKTPVLHWHGDTFELPKGAKRLASTP